MAIVVIGGSAKDSGKTALVCAVIAAFPHFEWTAVKITGHDYEPAGSGSELPVSPHRIVWEETRPGQETDTGRYLAAGARRALLVMRHGPELPVKEIRDTLVDDRNVIFESNRIIDALRPDVCIALHGGAATEVKASFRRLLLVADAVVAVGEGQVEDRAAAVSRFVLESPEELSPEMISWLRKRLGEFPQRHEAISRCADR